MGPAASVGVPTAGVDVHPKEEAPQLAGTPGVDGLTTTFAVPEGGGAEVGINPSFEVGSSLAAEDKSVFSPVDMELGVEVPPGPTVELDPCCGGHATDEPNVKGEPNT